MRFALEIIAQLLRDAIESLSDGFALYDADDRMVISNTAFARLWPEIAGLGFVEKLLGLGRERLGPRNWRIRFGRVPQHRL